MKKRLTIHQKIMRAARRGTGMRLTADDVWALRMDGCIEKCAENDDQSIVLAPSLPAPGAPASPSPSASTQPPSTAHSDAAGK